VKNREQGKSDSARNREVRVFFALWPDDDVRLRLHQLAQQQSRRCGGRVMRAETLHLTLLFMGGVPVERLCELQRAAAGVRALAFCFDLDRFAGWRHNAIGYVALAEIPEGLLLLSKILRASVAQTGFSFDRKSFKPHVTLLRKMEHPPHVQPISALEWKVREFVLVRSVLNAQGAGYEIIDRWPLDQGVLTP